MLLLQNSVCKMCLAGKRVTAAARGAEGNGPQVAHWAHCATHIVVRPAGKTVKQWLQTASGSGGSGLRKRQQFDSAMHPENPLTVPEECEAEGSSSYESC